MISYNTYDAHNNTSLVPVVASFNTNGKITLLYVRIDGEPYKVHTFIREKMYELPTFRCEIIDDNILKPIKLVSYKKEQVWGMIVK